MKEKTNYKKINKRKQSFFQIGIEMLASWGNGEIPKGS
jgi:hypothetical protein